MQESMHYEKQPELVILRFSVHSIHRSKYIQHNLGYMTQIRVYNSIALWKIILIYDFVRLSVNIK